MQQNAFKMFSIARENDISQKSQILMQLQTKSNFFQDNLQQAISSECGACLWSISPLTPTFCRSLGFILSFSLTH